MRSLWKALLVLLGMLILPVPGLAEAGQTLWVSTATSPVGAAPSDASALIKTKRQGDRISVVSPAADGGWWAVEVSGRPEGGYMPARTLVECSALLRTSTYEGPGFAFGIQVHADAQQEGGFVVQERTGDLRIERWPRGDRDPS